MTLAVGDVGIDFSGARPGEAAIKAAGAKFIMRYSAGLGNNNTNTHWKLCEPGEIQRAVAAGLDFIANCEWYETRVTEGAGAGQADGAADLAFWKARGLNKGASIYCSWDAAANTSLFGNVDAYLRAYNTALQGYYFVDCYGGTQYLKHALGLRIIRYGWRPNAGSWSNDGLPYQPPNYGRGYIAAAQAATPAAIWQTGNYWFSQNADENLLIRAACGSHLQAVVAPPPQPTPPIKPITEDEDEFMRIVVIDKAGIPAGTPWPGIFLFYSDGGLHHITNPAALTCYQKMGIPQAPTALPYSEFMALVADNRSSGK
jgi:hypothetical protein